MPPDPPCVKDILPVGQEILLAGKYLLRQLLRENGMGAVWDAEQIEPVRRQVAVKLIKIGLDSAQVLARFEAGRQALAVMDHPHIARVFDTGVDECGQPFFVMELVQGVPLTRFCDEARLRMRQRLELFVPICQAVQHAHQKGVIHRDLEPSNILVALYDGKPVPKVIGFGIAKAAMPTQCGAVVRAPEYMAPEQAGGTMDVDTRADIYSLGAILYELLTGTTPLGVARQAEGARRDLLAVIDKDTPLRPSLRMAIQKEASSIAALRQSNPARLTKQLHGDLDWIAMKALDKDRTRRYATADGLAQDIQRYLAKETVLSPPPGASDGLRKLARQHGHVLIAAATLLLLLLGAATVASSVRAVRAAEAEKQAVVDRDQAQQAEENAKAVLTFLQDNVLSAGVPKGPNSGRGKHRTLRQMVEEAEPKIIEAFHDRPLVEASLRDTLGSTYWFLGDGPQALKLYERALALRQAKLGEDHPETLASLSNLATAYRSAGQLEDALPLFEKAVALSSAKLGDGPVTLARMNTLGCAYLEAGRLYDAIQVLEYTFKFQTTKLGEDHPDRLTSMNDLASAFLSARQVVRAVPLLQQTLQLRKNKLGVDHPDTLVSMANLGVGRRAVGITKEAIALLEEALQRGRNRPGGLPASLAQVPFQLAKTYDQAELFTKAEPIYRDLLDQAREQFGAEDVRTASLMAVLGSNLLQQKKYAEAEPLLLTGYRGMKKREAKLPLSHKPHLTEARTDLVRLYEEIGKKDQAEKWRK
jgi:tetratricopeptide (TPR) repeat protein